MTDNEIIKALECCIKEDCESCPLEAIEHCVTMKDALDVTNRQNAKIKALIAGQETLQKYVAEKNAEIESLNKDLSNTISINHKERMELKAEIEFLKEQRDRYMQDATDFSIKVEQLKTENELLKIGGDCK